MAMTAPENLRKNTLMKYSYSIAHDRWAWADLGNCVENPDLFYHKENEPRASRRLKEKEAKLLCDSCPVKPECQHHAMDHRELYGVWGGMSENERHRLAGRQRSG